MQAVGRGDVSIGPLHLPNVLLVPQFGANMPSVAPMIDTGWDVRFTSARCTIAKKGIDLQGEREGNLYYLRIAEGNIHAHLRLATNKAKPQKLAIWYRRLGHRRLNKTAVKYLSSKISELDIERSTDHQGEKDKRCTCAVGRQQKEAPT